MGKAEDPHDGPTAGDTAKALSLTTSLVVISLGFTLNQVFAQLIEASNRGASSEPNLGGGLIAMCVGLLVFGLYSQLDEIRASRRRRRTVVGRDPPRRVPLYRISPAALIVVLVVLGWAAVLGMVPRPGSLR